MPIHYLPEDLEWAIRQITSDRCFHSTPRCDSCMSQTREDVTRGRGGAAPEVLATEHRRLLDEELRARLLAKTWEAKYRELEARLGEPVPGPLSDADLADPLVQLLGPGYRQLWHLMSHLQIQVAKHERQLDNHQRQLDNHAGHVHGGGR